MAIVASAFIPVEDHVNVFDQMREAVIVGKSVLGV